MDFLGKKRNWIILSAFSACLFGYVICQFALGGRSGSSNGFQPVNDQLQQLISESAVHSNNPSSKKEVQRESTPNMEAAKRTMEATTPTISAAAPSPVVPTINAEVGAPVNTTAESTVKSTSSSSIPNAPSDQRLNLNTATMEQLDSLPGIGVSKAKAIIDYRNKKGRFDRIEQLTDVKGIGEKMLEKLKPLIYVALP